MVIFFYRSQLLKPITKFISSIKAITSLGKGECIFFIFEWEWAYCIRICMLDFFYHFFLFCLLYFWHWTCNFILFLASWIYESGFAIQTFFYYRFVTDTKTLKWNKIIYHPLHVGVLTTAVISHCHNVVGQI